MRFVIHHHVTDPPHYDLMIEKGEVLHTWQIQEILFQDFIDGNKIEADKIQHHRKKYLHYEGPISCDRGMVEIYDSGKYNEISWEKDIIIELQGNLLKSKLSIISNHRNFFLKINSPQER